jgi:nitrilase
MTKLSILACQIDIPAVADAPARDVHLADMIAKIRAKLQEKPHDLVVLPELSSVDYSRASFDNLAEIAEELDGPSFQAFSALAKEFDTTIVFGMPRREGEKYFISHVAVGTDGALIGHYDKLHICQYGASMEKEYFERGDHLLVFEVKGVRMAPIICYDIRIPELSRTLVIDNEVDMILHCGAYARDESFYSWHHFAVSRAIENQIFFLSLNRAGKNYGNSLFCPPWVDEDRPALNFPDRGEHFASIEIDTGLIAQVRKDYTFLLDRFEDYSQLGGTT